MADEVEGKLIMTGTGAPEVYTAIGQLDAIGGLRVARREVQQIADAYFDGPERQLFSIGLALRVRWLNGRELLTIKGETRVLGGVLSREELEVEWSPEGLDEVLEALNQAGASLGGVEVAREKTVAWEAIEALGFVASRPRENRRVAMTLMQDGQIVAEVAADALSVTAGDVLVRHYEVECESKGVGDAGLILTVLGDLQSRYDGLEPWNISKLDMAQALETLANEDRLGPLMQGERLRAEGYRTIEALVER